MLKAFLEDLFDLGYTWVIGDRDLAVAVYREAGRGRWEVDGGSAVAPDGSVVYMIEVEFPFCEGGCGDRIPSSAGFCYQCGCEAHAEGWYDMDTGYARVGGR